MEPVFRTLEITAQALVSVTGTTITYQDVECIPRSGAAVIPVNHTSYVDWLPAALAPRRRGRRMRYLITAEMQQVKIVDFLIRHTKTIPVDRNSGATAYTQAVRLLRAGELVGLTPGATISRSFVWGAQRIWTKDHPRNRGRAKIPVVVAAGRPLAPEGGAARLDATLHAEMTALLHRVRDEHPHPAGAFWVPRRLGGSAPTVAEAKIIEETEKTERARRRAEQGR